MSSLLRILTALLVMLAASRSPGMLAAHDYSDKTVAEVLELLESNDRGLRVDAAMFLGYRYRKPGVVVNPPTYKEQHPEFPLPPHLVPSLASHLRSDPDDLVRIVAMRALGDLRSCTNTTGLVAEGLADTNSLVRIHTCETLIDISHDYSEPLVAEVVPTLRRCLLVDGDVEPTWIAAWVTGHLGSAGTPLLPELKQLAKHKSSKVRHYAREAAINIQREVKKHAESDVR